MYIYERRKCTKFLHRRIRRCRCRLNGLFGFQLDGARSGARKTRRRKPVGRSASITWSVPDCLSSCWVPYPICGLVCLWDPPRLVFVKPAACVDVWKGLFCFFGVVFASPFTFTCPKPHGRLHRAPAADRQTHSCCWFSPTNCLHCTRPGSLRTTSKLVTENSLNRHSQFLSLWYTTSMLWCYRYILPISYRFHCTYTAMCVMFAFLLQYYIFTSETNTYFH